MNVQTLRCPGCGGAEWEIDFDRLYRQGWVVGTCKGCGSMANIENEKAADILLRRFKQRMSDIYAGQLSNCDMEFCR